MFIGIKNLKTEDILAIITVFIACGMTLSEVKALPSKQDVRNIQKEYCANTCGDKTASVKLGIELKFIYKELTLIRDMLRKYVDVNEVTTRKVTVLEERVKHLTVGRISNEKIK